MAINTNNIFIEGMRGTVGRKMTVRISRSGKIIIGKKRGASTKPLTLAQAEIREVFKRGVTYANAVMADPAKKAMYALKTKGDQSAFNVAMRDACKPPKVVLIDAAQYQGAIGNQIRIEATDDFKVSGVQLEIYDAANQLVEQGAALLHAGGLYWQYTATQNLAVLAGASIKATAKDTPGNEGSLQINL